jgi:hypothetical protein
LIVKRNTSKILVSYTLSNSTIHFRWLFKFEMVKLKVWILHLTAWYYSLTWFMHFTLRRGSGRIKAKITAKYGWRHVTWIIWYYIFNDWFPWISRFLWYRDIPHAKRQRSLSLRTFHTKRKNNFKTLLLLLTVQSNKFNSTHDHTAR